MRTALRKSVWDYLQTLPEWLEITIWIVIMILCLVLIAGIVLLLVYGVLRLTNRIKPKKRNEHQLENRRMEDKGFLKILADMKNPWAVLVYCIKEEKLFLTVIILAALLFFNVSYTVKEGLSVKPGIKADELKEGKKGGKEKGN